MDTSATESTLPPQSYTPGPRTTFSEIWSESWRLYMKKVVAISALLVIPSALSLIVRILLSPQIYNFVTGLSDKKMPAEEMGKYLISLLPMLVGGTLLALVVFILLAMIITAMVLRIAAKADDENYTLMNALEFSFKRLGSMIALGFRQFFYVLWKILIPGLIIAALIAVSTFAQKSESSSSLQPLIVLGVFIASIAIIVILVRVSLSLVFSDSLLFIGDEVTSKGALQKSLELSKGLLWRIFANFFIVALIFTLIGALYGGVAGLIFSPVSQATLSPEDQQRIVADIMKTDSDEAPMTDEERQVLKNEFQKSMEFNGWFELALIPLTVCAGGFGMVFRVTFTRRALEEKGMEV